MAELQEHGRRFQRPRDFVRPQGDLDAIMGREGRLANGWATLPRPAVDVLEAGLDRFAEAARDVGKGPETYGLIHGDLHVRNAVLHQGRAGAIDFDDCGEGYYLFDIAAAMDLLEFRVNYPELRHAFLAGYEDVRALSTTERVSINAFLAARWGTVCLYLARDPSREKQLRRVLGIVLPKLQRFLRRPDSLG